MIGGKRTCAERNVANQILDVHAMIQFCQNSFPAVHFELILQMTYNKHYQTCKNGFNLLQH